MYRPHEHLVYRGVFPLAQLVRGAGERDDAVPDNHDLVEDALDLSDHVSGNYQARAVAEIRQDRVEDRFALRGIDAEALPVEEIVRRALRAMVTGG